MSKKPATTKAPSHLAAATRAWYQQVCADFELEPHHLRLLQLSAEAWDRCVDARKAIAEHGTTYTDRFGSPRLRPEVSVERDSRLAFCKTLRELSLDIEPPAESPRLPSRSGTRG